MDVDTLEPVRSGPNYRILPYADSVIMPGHARDKQEIWGSLTFMVLIFVLLYLMLAL